LSPSLVILGAGYTARVLLPLTLRHYSHLLATSRDPDRHLRHLPPGQRIRFDLAQEDTWKNIPVVADLFWCFPAAPPDLVKRFATTIAARSRRLVVLGSTSAYDVGASREYPPPWIDESAPIDLTKPRVRGEEFLRSDCGAILLRVAGIYGPGRNPVDWIRTGRVNPSRKYVNLIHVQDLARICLETLAHGKSGEVYNVSDGVPRTWEEISHIVRERWATPSVAKKETAAPGKRIANGKLLRELGITILHSDLCAELRALE
jgi:dTDP-4-dehydrorhamnose reductase